MYLRPQWPVVAYIGAVVQFHITQLLDCSCEPRFALEQLPGPAPVQPEEWPSGISLFLEPASIAPPSGGVTVSSGTGEGLWEGFAPVITYALGSAAT
jgi:hypothetical protein